MFWLIEPSSGQIQNIVPVHSVSAHIMGSHIVYKIVLTLKIMFYSVSIKLFDDHKFLQNMDVFLRLRNNKTI
jgi:hypothetical protein